MPDSKSALCLRRGRDSEYAAVDAGKGVRGAAALERECKRRITTKVNWSFGRSTVDMTGRCLCQLKRVGRAVAVVG